MLYLVAIVHITYTLETNALTQQQQLTQQFAAIFVELRQLLMKLCSTNKLH